jgi:hypothetical protein
MPRSARKPTMREEDIALDSSGKLYIADRTNNRIRMLY